MTVKNRGAEDAEAQKQNGYKHDRYANICLFVPHFCSRFDAASVRMRLLTDAEVSVHDAIREVGPTCRETPAITSHR
jgi:hypothetical protein